MIKNTGESTLFNVVFILIWNVGRWIRQRIQGKPRRWDIDCSQEARQSFTSWRERIYNRSQYYQLHASHELGSPLRILLSGDTKVRSFVFFFVCVLPNMEIRVQILIIIYRLLVYEFMKNGSLDKWIFPPYNSRDRLLDWSTRFHVAVGTSQGIAYFHEQCRDRIIHCDIKPENILLDENFCPKVSDFGLAKLMGREHSQVVTMVRGTRGYLAPEWVSNRAITVKADVYSYGMLLLEIVGGRRNLDMTLDADDFFFPGWAFKVSFVPRFELLVHSNTFKPQKCAQILYLLCRN